MRLHLAVTDPGQLAEFAFAAQAFPGITLMPISQLDRVTPPPGIDETFSGNARRRAEAYCALVPGAIVVAEDSGFFVRCLEGAPGTRSDEYADDMYFAGEGSRAERNIACVLEKASRRRYRDASYVCSLAAVRDGELLAIGTGEVEGQLMDEPSEHAHHDFDRGYERILSILEYGCSMAELDPDARVRTSHHGRALVDLIRRLSYTLGH
jgi:XTP/dITP diphosphohydrolase